MLNASNDQTELLHERKLAAIFNSVFNKAYIICYYIGIYTALAIKSVANSARFVAGFAIRLFCLLLSKLKKININVSEPKRIIKGYRAVFKQSVEIFKTQGLIFAVKGHFKLLASAVKRNKKTALWALNYLAPAAAVIVLVITICFWSGVTFALEVRYNDTVAYINDESVFNKAVELVMDRMLAGDGKDLIGEPEYSLKLVSDKNLIGHEEMSSIIVSSTDKLCEATGIYKNDQLLAVCSDVSEIQSSIDAYLNSYKTDSEVKSVDFTDNIEFISGIYPTSYLKPASEIKDAYLTSGKDTALSVKIVRNVTYTEEIPFGSVEIQNNKLSKSYRKVTKEGSNGLANVCAEVTLVDGVEVDRVVLSSEVVKEPENEEVTVGTAEPQKLSAAKSLTSTNSSAGVFCWPIKRVAGSYVSSYFGDGRGHKGYDFAAPRGTDIYSVADGTVVSINSSGSGYGLHFVIDHGNGLKTLYAHCSVINVKVGQKVSKGEKIAEVGRTGYSTGNHLHLEVWENGRVVDPAKYFGK